MSQFGIEFDIGGPAPAAPFSGAMSTPALRNAIAAVEAGRQAMNSEALRGALFAVQHPGLAPVAGIAAPSGMGGGAAPGAMALVPGQVIGDEHTLAIQQGGTPSAAGGASAPMSPTVKYVLIGGAVLALGAGAYLLMRPRRSNPSRRRRRGHRRARR